MGYKLKLKDVKPMIWVFLAFKQCELFKSGKNVVLHIFEMGIEEQIIDTIHKNNLLCIPETIPSNGYYKIVFPDGLP